MVLVSLIAGRLGESFSIQPIYMQPPSTKGRGHLLLALGHHKKQGAAQCLFPCHLKHTCWGQGRRKKKKEKKSRKKGKSSWYPTDTTAERERYSWGWCTAHLPLLARTTSPVSLSYLSETDLLGWTVKDWSITTADKRESLWNFKTFKSPTSKKWTLLALGETISFHKFPWKQSPNVIFLERSWSYSIFKSKMVSQW